MIHIVLGLAPLLAPISTSPAGLLAHEASLTASVAASPQSADLHVDVAQPERRLSTDERDAIYDTLSNEPRITPTVRVVNAVGPSGVYIETDTTQRVNHWMMGPRDVNTRGGGTGVVVHEDGFIVTNYHVVKGAHKIQVSFADDLEPYPADLLSYKESEDLALLLIRLTPERRAAWNSLASANGNVQEPKFPAVRMGQSHDLMPGEQVVAIGNPHGQAHTVSTGIVSGLHRQVQVQNLLFRDLIQTDASINLGNSGGPLLNIRGELIGINTVMNLNAENIGFAIPVDRVRETLAEELFPNARTSWLGFELAPGEPLVVSHVWPGSPADQARICEGDQLVDLGGTPLTSKQAFLDASLQLHPQEATAITVQRSGRDATTNLVPWDRLDGLLYERVGIVARELVLGRDSYLIIDVVAVDGPADQLGLKPGDLIPAVRPNSPGMMRPLRIRDRRDLAGVIEHLNTGTSIAVDVYRDLNENNQYEKNELLKGEFRLR
mgnify:CR=1 FL=1